MVGLVTTNLLRRPNMNALVCKRRVVKDSESIGTRMNKRHKMSLSNYEDKLYFQAFGRDSYS